MTTPPFSPPPVLPSSALPDWLWLAQTDVITVPLQTFSHRPFVQVVLDGHPALFLLDTSIAQTSVDATTLADANRQASAQSLQIGGLRFLHVPAVHNDVRAYSETYLGAGADGVIGADLFARFPVALDYKNGSVSIFRASKAAIAARPAQSTVVSLTMLAGVPTVPVSLGGQPAGLFGIDTGSGVDFEVRASIITSKHIALDGTLPELQEARVSGAMHGETARARAAAIGLLQVAAPLIAMPDERQRWLPAGINGMLGARLFEKMTLTVDVPGQNLVISSIQSSQPSIYDRSGAWLVSHSGTIFVHDVLPGSPADRAGLSIGDQVIKVNTVAVSSLDLVRQALLQPAGTHVTISYKRARRSRTATLVLRNLL